VVGGWRVGFSPPTSNHQPPSLQPEAVAKVLIPTGHKSNGSECSHSRGKGYTKPPATFSPPVVLIFIRIKSRCVTEREVPLLVPGFLT